MQICHWENEHYAHSDVELNIPRQSKLTSYCSAPWAPDAMRPYAGLVLVLHGYGGKANDDYYRKLREYLVEKYDLLAVSVNYHASGLHAVDFSKRYAFPKQFLLKILNYLPPSDREELLKGSVEIEGHKDWVKFPDPEEKYQKWLSELIFQVEVLEQQSILSSALSISENLDHQNFGVLQALDILTALYELSQAFSFEKSNVIAFGSSHGGYLGHLCSKIAPNTFRAVIEGSSYPYTPLYFIANRPYQGLTPYFNWEFPVTVTNNQGVTQELKKIVDVYFDTPWELADATSPYYFGTAPMDMRNLNKAEHWQTVANKSRRQCQYRMLHSSRDETFQPIEDKRLHAQQLISTGFDVVYKEKGEDDIDGRLVKHLNHGMGASQRALFDLFYPTIRPTFGTMDNELGTVVDFKCGDKTYLFDHTSNPMLQII